MPPPQKIFVFLVENTISLFCRILTGLFLKSYCHGREITWPRPTDDMVHLWAIKRPTDYKHLSSQKHVHLVHSCTDVSIVCDIKHRSAAVGKCKALHDESMVEIFTKNCHANVGRF